MDTMAIPVKFEGGSIRTHTEDSDQYYAHLLSFAIQTEPGELILNPTYGTLDPLFDDDLTFQVALTAAQFVPEVTVTNVETRADVNGKVGISVNFERNEQ